MPLCPKIVRNRSRIHTNTKRVLRFPDRELLYLFSLLDTSALAMSASVVRVPTLVGSCGTVSILRLGGGGTLLGSRQA